MGKLLYHAKKWERGRVKERGGDAGISQHIIFGLTRESVQWEQEMMQMLKSHLAFCIRWRHECAEFDKCFGAYEHDD
jgi:hypothetical protein